MSPWRHAVYIGRLAVFIPVAVTVVAVVIVIEVVSGWRPGGRD